MADQDVRGIMGALEVMGRMETACAEFYKACSDVFPLSKEFWVRLAREEIGHAEIISELMCAIVKHPEMFDAGKFSPVEALERFISRLQENLGQLKSGRLTEHDALLTAYLIENTFAEKEFASVITAKNPVYSKALEKLASDSAVHRDIVVGKIGTQKAT